jgi:nicotinate dehydrogenase subunit B
MNAPLTRPGSLRGNPRLSQWLGFEADGSVTVRSGKVEIGQGILTALAQIVARELGVPLDRIRMAPARTGTHPDEGVTSGSLSIQDSGVALRQVCAEARALHRQEAARRWSLPADGIDLREGVFIAPDGRTASYADLRDAGLLERDASPAGLDVTAATLGESAQRLDIPDKVYGRPRFIHDLATAGLLHGRILRPANAACRVLRADLSSARACPGVEAVLRDGLLFGVLADTSAHADAALAKVAAAVEWDVPPALPDENAIADWLRSQPTESATISEKSGPSAPVAQTLRASYSRPFVAHASLAPSCALARWDGDRLEVWSHTQGIYNLRRDLAIAFGVAEGGVTVQHVEGAGCYGHNGADDVAWDAAWLARTVPGRTVRMLWTRAGEFADEPYGSASVVKLEADLDAGGTIVGWRHAIWSMGHSSRPGRAPTPTLLGSWLTAEPFPRLAAINMPLATGGGAERNSVPGYDFANQAIASHRSVDTALRTSALRGLGAFVNVFAAESFMDELAAAAGSDPVRFRLRHLADARGREVIERAVARSGWQPGAAHEEGVGWGIGYARYKGTGAWCAVVARVEAGEQLRVRRLTLAADLGQVVNADGAANQLEGGAIQAASITLKEAVRFDRERITSVDWESYPILRFSEVPAVDVELVESGEPSLGAGECSFGPTAAAIANALCDAIGLRVRDLPLTPERLLAAVHAG